MYSLKVKILGKTVLNIIGKLWGDSLKARASRGVVTLATGTIVERAIRFVRNMILARLLVPDEFGLMAIVLSAAVAFEAFTEVGVNKSVIHNKRGDEKEYLNVAWFFQTIRGLALFLVAFLASPLISSFYENPRLLVLLRVAFVSIALNGLVSPRVYVLEKRLQFAKFILLYRGSSLVGTLVSLGLAFFVIRNVWALVIGFLAEAVFRCLLSFILCSFRPMLSIDKESLAEILKYARRMLGVPILTIIAFQLDVLVLGKVVSAEQVGLYWLGLQLSMQMSTLFSKVIYPVLLPAFAQKQDDKQFLCRSIMKVTTYTGVFGIPITTFLVICAGSILSVVYGSKYAAVAIPFGLLCVYSLVRMQGLILSQVYFAIGKPHLHRRFVLLRLAVLAILIYPGAVLFGLTGAAAVVLLANCIGLCMQIVWMKKPIGLQFREYATCWLQGLLLSTIVLIPTMLLRFLYREPPILSLVIAGLACLLACGVGLFSLLQVHVRHLVLSGEDK